MAGLADTNVVTEDKAQGRVFTLRIRRYDPESGEAPYWDEHTIELEPHRSVLEGILQAKARFDGSIGIRCSCRAAICGSCGVRINGQPGLACHTHLDRGAAIGQATASIEVEPMGNMPVIKDLIVDMDAVHWKKIQRVTPWLINKEPIPEREYIVDREAMVDVTQSMACIQCGACVSDCLSMEVDPLFIGPAALAKAYRFVGDPRDAQQYERLNDLSAGPARHLRLHALLQVHRRLPQGRRADEPDHAPAPPRRLRPPHHRPQQRPAPRAGVRRRCQATTACCTRPSCCRAPTAATRGSASSHPPAGLELVDSLPVITKALAAPQGDAEGRAEAAQASRRTTSRRPADLRRDRVREQRLEFNLYITGYRRGQRDGGRRTA